VEWVRSTRLATGIDLNVCPLTSVTIIALTILYACTCGFRESSLCSLDDPRGPYQQMSSNTALSSRIINHVIDLDLYSRHQHLKRADIDIRIQCPRATLVTEPPGEGSFVIKIAERVSILFAMVRQPMQPTAPDRQQQLT
jgi:hypothetical protein